MFKKSKTNTRDNATGNFKSFGSLKPLVDFPAEMSAALKINAPAPAHVAQATIALRDESGKQVAVIDQQIRTLQAQIQDLQQQMEALAKEAAVHRENLAMCNMILAPIRNVPLDILCEIARHAVPEHPSASTQQAPLSLCQVSSAWRTAVLSSSDVWDTLYIQMCSGSEDRLGRLSSLVNSWCGRAKHRTLSLFLYFPIDFDPLETPEPLLGLKRALCRIAPVMPRVRHLGLGARYIERLFSYLAGLPWKLDALTVLNLVSWWGEGHVDGEADDEYAVPALDFFTQAVNLRQIAIGNEFFALPKSNFALPWSNLTSVCLAEGLSADKWLQVLELCPQMLNGRFFLRSGDEEQILLSQAPLGRTHGNLQELDLSLEDFHIPAVEILSLVEFPNLRKLEIYHGEPGHEAACTPPSLNNRFQNFKHLRSLTVDDGWESENCATIVFLVDVLRVATCVEELALTTSSAFSADLLKTMHFNFESANILPRLTKLHIAINESCEFPEFETILGVFTGMVKSRCLLDTPETCCSLEYLCASTESGNRYGLSIREQIRESLQDCVSNGLVLTTSDCADSRKHPRKEPFQRWKILAA